MTHAGRVPARIQLPAHVHGAAFHVRDVEVHGASAKRLRGHDVQRPFTAVRSVGLDLTSIRDRCIAYEPLIRPGDAFSHETAAELYGLPVPETMPALHVTSQPGRARARARGVIGHESSTSFVATRVDIHPVVPVGLLWCQLATALGQDDLVAVGDASITGRRIAGGTRGAPLATLEQLRDAVDGWGSRRGARAPAWALPRLRFGVDSRPETLTRLCLVEAGLPEPLVGDPTPVADGRVLHPDLKWPHWRILLEYEGDGHRTNRGKWKRDIARKGDFEAVGWLVIRVTSDDLFVDRAAFIARVRSYIRIAEARARAR